MNGLLKKAMSLIIVIAISMGIVFPAGATSVEGAVPVEIGYSLSADSLRKGETATVNFFFKNFSEANIDCTAFQIDVYVDPEIFTVESMKCTLDGTGALMYTTKFNSDDNKVKTIYFNTAGTLPKDSKDICNFSVKLNRDFEKATDVQLNVTLAMVLDIDNNRYDVTYSSPVIKCLPGETTDEPITEPTKTPEQSGGAIETIAPVVTDAPVVTPETSAGTATIPEYTVTYLDSNGRLITTEKVKKGSAALNRAVPYRPGYDFIGWKVNSGSLMNVVADMSVYAVYELSDTLYTIEVEGGTVNGQYDPLKAKYDDCVVVKLDDVSIPADSYFVGWKKSDSDKIVSYNKTYSFLVSGSVKLSPVFSLEDQVATPQIVLNNPVINLNGIIFSCENYIPAGYDYSGSGIIITKDSTTGKDAEKFVLNGTNTDTYRADKYSINSQFSVMSLSLLSEVVYVRAYLIYKNSNGEKITVYSDIAMHDPSDF